MRPFAWPAHHEPTAVMRKSLYPAGAPRHNLPACRTVAPSSRVVREAVGRDVDIGVDVHAKFFEVRRAARLARALEPYLPPEAGRCDRQTECFRGEAGRRYPGFEAWVR